MELREFSFTIKRASFDRVTNEMRWKADTSDTIVDSRGDSMTMELYQDFIQRIESGERPPERFCSDFWSGGLPYLSISHYSDMNGKAVPGTVDAVYVDGNYLKAKGRCSDTPLGKAVWNTLRHELTHKSEIENPVRVSIAFYDYAHRHKSNGFVFNRDGSGEICPECARESLFGDFGGLEYLRGHLVHLAMTRVPANERTIMEVDMTTRKEDAASIVGESLAEEIDAESLVSKSEALVIKMDDTDTVSEGVSDPVVVDPILEAVMSLQSNLTALTDVVMSMKSQMEKKPEMDDDMDQDDDMEDAEEMACSKKKKPAVEMSMVDGDQEHQPTMEELFRGLGAAFGDAMAPLTQKMDILIASQSRAPAQVSNPTPRSINPALLTRSNAQEQVPSTGVKISDFARKSVGLD